MRARRLLQIPLFVALGACADPHVVDDGPDAAAAADERSVPGEGETGWVDIQLGEPYGLQTVPYKVVNGMAVWDGDIMLGPVEAVAIPRRGGAAHIDFSRRWTNGQIPYRFDEDVFDDTITTVKAVMDEIEHRTPIDFIDLGTGSAPAFLEIHDQYHDPDNSAGGWVYEIGMDGGEQRVYFNGPPSEQTVLHELLHVAGMFHEQARPDRDAFIDVHFACIEEDSIYQFDFKPAMNIGPYDFNSIMHYSTGKFCVDPMPANCELPSGNDTVCKTMTKVSDGGPIFRGATISTEDANTLWRMYYRQLGNNETGDSFGDVVATADFNGDGYGDVAVGAPDEDHDSIRGSGQVMIFRGTANGLVPWQVLEQDDIPGQTIEACDLLGASLAAADVDGDGMADLLVGSPDEDYGSIQNAGAAYLFRGQSRGLEPWKTFTQNLYGQSSNETDDRFGESVAIGWLGGTGQPQATISIGAPYERTIYRSGSSRSGAVFLYQFGEIFDVFHKVANPSSGANERFGEEIAIGWLRWGSNQSLAVGAPGRSLSRGAVEVFHGKNQDGELVEYEQTFVRTNGLPFDEMGAALAIGDVRADALQELVVGLPGRAANAGEVIVYTPSTVFLGKLQYAQTIHQNGSFEAGDEFGAAIAIGQVDPSTLQHDLVIGAPGENEHSGAISVFRGGMGDAVGVEIIRQDDIQGQHNEANDRFGQAIALGEITGAGPAFSSDDLFNPSLRAVSVIVGSPQENIGSIANAGTVGVFHAMTWGLSGNRIYHQEFHAND